MIFQILCGNQKRIGERIANEILMMFRAGKKYSREVSLFEPIGVDKDGESVSLVDVIELETKEVLEDLILDQDIRELYEAFSLLFKASGAVCGKAALRPFRDETPHPAGNREAAWHFALYVSRIEKRALKNWANI